MENPMIDDVIEETSLDVSSDFLEVKPSAIFLGFNVLYT